MDYLLIIVLSPFFNPILLQLKVNTLEVQLKEAEMEIHRLKVGKRVSTARNKVRSKSVGLVTQRHKTRALDADSDSGKYSGFGI